MCEYLKVNNDNIDMWIWCKLTYTGLLLNYNANCPKKWKFGLILCLLYSRGGQTYIMFEPHIIKPNF